VSTTYKKAKRRFKKVWEEAVAADPELADFWWTDEKTGLQFHMRNFDTPSFTGAISTLADAFTKDPSLIQTFLQYRDSAVEEMRKQVERSLLHGAAR
jgi:hypothetical protein